MRSSWFALSSTVMSSGFAKDWASSRLGSMAPAAPRAAGAGFWLPLDALGSSRSSIRRAEPVNAGLAVLRGASVAAVPAPYRGPEEGRVSDAVVFRLTENAEVAVRSSSGGRVSMCTPRRTSMGGGGAAERDERGHEVGEREPAGERVGDAGRLPRRASPSRGEDADRDREPERPAHRLVGLDQARREAALPRVDPRERCDRDRDEREGDAEAGQDLARAGSATRSCRRPRPG